MKNIDYPKTISIIATLLLCAGIISQTVYYFFFNIPITNFLSISEILLLFTQDIIRYVLILLLLLLIGIIFNFNKGSLNFKRFCVDYCQTKDLGDRIYKYLKRRLGKIFYFVFGFLIFLSLLKEGNKIVFLFGLYFSIELIYFIVRFFIFEYQKELRLKGQLKKEDSNFALFFSYSLHFIFFVIVWSISDVQDVKYEQKYINVSFKTNYGTFLSDSTKYYIGQTEKYVFFYNSIIDKTFVYKRDNIEEMYFGKINYFNQEQSKKKNLSD